MDIKGKVTQKVDEVGKKIDKDMRESAEKHDLPVWKVWLFWAMAVVCAGLVLYFVL